jgi:L-malate glycosyltransferase
VKKRVLQFIGSFNQGGSERQAVALTRLLRRDGRFDVSLATLCGEGVLLSEAEKLDLPQIPEFPLDSFFSPGFVRQAVRCSRYLRENKIDIVHTHDFYTNVFGMTAAKLAGTQAKVASKREILGMRSPNQVRVEKLAFGIANAVVVNSQAVADYLQKIGVSESKCALIYNGLDPDRFAADRCDPNEFCRQHSIKPNEKVITLVANLRHDVKNVPMLLRAAKTVSKSFPEAVFVIAGEGELETSLREIAASFGIAERVHFIGRCSDVPSLLAASDICVLTSTSEGFSNSILEYMAAGKPVVATNVGGANEAIRDGETGFLIRSDDDAEMAAKLSMLLNDNRLAAEFGSAGLESVRTRFSEVSQLESTLGLYDSLLK